MTERNVYTPVTRGSLADASVFPTSTQQDLARRSKAGGLLGMVEKAAEKARIPTPALYLWEGHPGAWAHVSVRGSAKIVFGYPLAGLLRRDEAMAVVEHETKHVRDDLRRFAHWAGRAFARARESIDRMTMRRLSRRDEDSADAYAAENAGPGNHASALITINWHASGGNLPATRKERRELGENRACLKEMLPPDRLAQLESMARPAGPGLRDMVRGFMNKLRDHVPWNKHSPLYRRILNAVEAYRAGRKEAPAALPEGGCA